MADTTETVIFKVDISSYEEGLATLTKSIKGLQDQKAIYDAQAKKGDSEAAKQVEALNVQIKNTQQEYRTTQKVLQGYTAAQQKQADTMNFLNNSIQTNRDLLKQMSAQLLNTINPSQKLIDKTKQLSDTLKKQESALGDTRRNVGNYAEGFADVIKNIGGAAAQQVGFNAAMAATPAGAVVEIFGSLFNVLSRNKEAMDLIEQGMSAISATADTAAESIFNFGSALADSFKGGGGKSVGEFISGIFNNSIEGYRKFGSELAKGNVVAALKGLADGLTGAKNGVDNLTGAIAKAVEEGKNAAKATQDFRDAERELNVELSEQEITIYKLKKASQDRTKTDEERIKLLKQALQLEQQRAEKEFALAERGVKAAELNANAAKHTDESEDKLSQARVKRNEAYKASIVFQEKIANELSALEKSLADEKEKIVQQSFENERTIRNAEISMLGDSLDKRLKAFDLTFEKEEEALRAAGATEVFITELRNSRIREITTKFNQEQLDATKKLEDDKQKALHDSLKKQEEAYKENSDAQKKNTDELLSQQQKKFDNIITIVTGVNNAIISILQTASDWINRSAQEQIDSLETQAKRSSITQKQFEAETREIKLKAWKQSKAIAITEASMNTANAIMAQLSNPTPYVGYVLAALAAATGAAQIAFIATQKPPKFAKGGRVIDIDGNSHENGGTPIHVNGRQVAEAEKDEGLFIMKKNAYQEMKKYSDWNQAFGGNSWGVKTNHAALGGNIASVSDGGFVTREVMNNVNNAEMMRVAVSDALRKQAAPVVSVVEIDRVNKARNKSVRVAGL